MSLKACIHDSNLYQRLSLWWHFNVTNYRTRKQIREYLAEADDKVWLMRSFPSDNPEIELKRVAEVLRIQNTYKDIPEVGYGDWEYGYWCGVMSTLRWVLGDDEKSNLDS